MFILKLPKTEKILLEKLKVKQVANGNKLVSMLSYLICLKKMENIKFYLRPSTTPGMHQKNMIGHLRLMELTQSFILMGLKMKNIMHKREKSRLISSIAI